MGFPLANSSSAKVLMFPSFYIISTLPQRRKFSRGCAFPSNLDCLVQDHRFVNASACSRSFAVALHLTGYATISTHLIAGSMLNRKIKIILLTMIF